MKIVFSVIGLMIVVGVFAITCLLFFVDADKLKPVLIAEVKSKTGYDLTIDGKLTWSVYPHIAIKVHHLQLRLPLQSQVLVDASDVYLAVDMMKLWQAQSQHAFQSKIAVSHFRLVNLKLENVSANINVIQNKLTLNAITASLYGGTLQGTVSVSLFEEPEWEWDVEANRIQLKPLLEDANGIDSKIKIDGIALFKMQAKTRGNNREKLFSQLNGNTVFTLNNGVLQGIDLNYFLQLADAILHKQPTDTLVNTKQTMFTGLSGTASVKNGIVNTNDLSLITPTFTTTAQGQIELLSRQLHFNLAIKPTLQNTKMKWDIPVLLTGDFNQPEIQLDVMGIQKIVASIEIDNLKEKAAEQIQKHIPGKTGKLLQKLLGK